MGPLRKIAAAMAAAGLVVAIAATGSAQAGDVPATITPVGTWHLTAMKIQGQPTQTCPFQSQSPFWYCEDDNGIEIKSNGKYKADLPIIGDVKGPWFWNHTNVIVFEVADDASGGDARAYGIKLKADKMRIITSQVMPDGSQIRADMIFERVVL